MRNDEDPGRSTLRRETPAQRERRLERQREYNRRRRRASSTSHPSSGAENEMETEEHYARRLEHQREYNARRRAHCANSGAISTSESHEQRLRRLDRQREYGRRRRGCDVVLADSNTITPAISLAQESEGVRQSRLMRHREYMRRIRAEGNGSGYGNIVISSDSGDQHISRPSIDDRPTQHEDGIIAHLDRSQEDSDRLSQLSRTQIDAIDVRLTRSLGAEGLDERVCAVCDRLELVSMTEIVHGGHTGMFDAMRRVLRCPTESLPLALLAQYDCTDIDYALAQMMLSREGVRSSVDRTELIICRDCYQSLSRGGDKPPKYAIANGFYIGSLPQHLQDATWIEKVMTQLVTVVAQTRVMRGGRHRSIRSHCMVFDATPGPPATLLPRRIDRAGPYRVVLAGPMTSEQAVEIRKLHQARGSMVNNLLQFYKLNNRLYQDVEVETVEGVVIADEILIEHDDFDIGNRIDEDQDSIVSRSDAILVSDRDQECTVVERNILLAEEEVVDNFTFAQRIVDLNSHEPAATPRLRVDHSSIFAKTANIEAKMYPHLFPFGRGHPQETRTTYVSKRDCMRHYAMLSSRRFAQDSTFVLTAFARLSLENMYTLTSVKCQRNDSIFEGYESLSREDLAAALIANERRQRGEQRQPSPSPTAERFLRSVELGSVSVWGSSAERRQCRQEAFGYQTRFGQPSLFLTLTPNTDNSYAMAHYTGILSVDTLFDALEARVPTPVEMRQAAMKDDCASARLFMRTVDAFTSEVLGIDTKTGTTRPEGGLFGKTRAYYGMVETQGRGTLHIHFLIWLFGAPVNSDDYEDRLAREGEAFTDRLRVFADSIITNQVPLPVSNVACQRCQARESFESVPIPAKARRNRVKRCEEELLEPALIRCSSCGQTCSSQHVLREALLQYRPPHWPPPLRPLTCEEKKQRISREMPARESGDVASTIIEDRELILTLMEQDDSDEMADWWLKVSNSTQRPYTHPDEDPMRSDSMHRLIEMTPPSLDDRRMQPEHYAYMLSTLALNYNMHSWSHTGSCFKASRATSNSSLCRYGFPRERVETTCVTGPSVKIKRPLGHEYINGYNPTIMAAFKCNHDIQVLFGGKDAINRIYYCCKYVTKPQRQIDSTTAVALASFQRRQAKEAMEDASEAPAPVSQLRRRRVTSMIHTFTNKQEIAGPLAALYLLRGSCCYSSATCVKLPLADALKQLQRAGGYNCSLVQRRTTEDLVFVPATSLDDYIYRPDKVVDLGLYEYTMKCYRRQLTGHISEGHMFKDGHPLSSSHCVAYRRKEVVPVIKGPRLPRWRETMTNDECEEYAKIALVLFKPFRGIDDLLGGHEENEFPWYGAFRDWKFCRSDLAKNVMGNLNDYHAGRDAENEAVVNTGDDEDNSADHSDSEYSASDDGYGSNDCGVDTCGTDTTDLMESIEASVTLDGQDIQVFPTPAAFSDRIRVVLDMFDKHRLVAPFAEAVATVHGTDANACAVDQMSVEALRKWVDNAESDTSDAVEPPDDAQASAFLERPTTVNEIIDHSLQADQLAWQMELPQDVPHETPMYCGIAAMSRSFTLNRLQHGAFALVGTHLLRRWRVVSSTSTPVTDEELQRRQLLMFLGGEGGTGKSRVIRAIEELCRSWYRSGSLILSAMTGKAASVINGRTLASFMMALRGPGSHVAMINVDCLVVDEVSMMSKDQLLQLDRLLRKAKRVNAVPFGGIHIILVGDFLQLPPVGADPLFVDPATKVRVSLQDYEGFRLWRQFDKVVVLQESVRFRDDPEWGEGCSKARYGEWTPRFLEIINSRVINAEGDEESTQLARTVFVTPDNDTRSAINEHFVASVSKQLTFGRYPVRVVANFKGALNKLSGQDIMYIMGLPDTSFGRMAPYLDLIQGLPIQITQNIRTKKGVANGTMGTLHSVKFPPGTIYRQALDKRSGMVVSIPDKRPLYALVRLQRDNAVSPIGEGVDPSLFPVFPDAEAFSKANIRLTPSLSGEPRSLSIKIQQFPFVCAIGATVYKVQGESLKSVAVVDWKVSLRGANRPQQAYLMVSRAVKRDALTCLKPMTAPIAAWARPPQAAIDEEARLAQASEATLKAISDVSSQASA